MNNQIPCVHFPLCSGCSINDNVDKPPIYDPASQFFRSLGVSFIINAGSPIKWRYRAKLAVRGTSQEPKIGLYREGSHEVVAIPQCLVHHPAINRGVDRLREFIRHEKIEPYEENLCRGELRYVQLTVEQDTGKIQLVLVWNGRQVVDSIFNLWNHFPDLWHSIWVNFNVRHDNVILGTEWRLLYGEKYLWESFDGVDVCYHPASFLQANLVMYESMLKKLGKYVSSSDQVLEHYAGVGAIGLYIASKCRRVHCIEFTPEAIDCFNKSREKLSSETKDKITFEIASAADQYKIPEWVDTIVLDPPRKGVHPMLMRAIQQATHIKKLMYVSCGWSSFQRDCKYLISHQWKIQHAEAYVFFPGTDHIETLCVFTRD